MLWALYYAGLLFPFFMPVVYTYWVIRVFVYRVWIDPCGAAAAAVVRVVAGMRRR